MSRSIALSVAFSTGKCQPDRMPCDLFFGLEAVFRYLLDHVAVSITGGKIHFCVDSGRIISQYQLDKASRFYKLLPVNRAQEPKTADAVADGNLVGGLLPGFRLDHLLYGQTGFKEPLFDPGQRQRQCSPLTLQAAGKLCNKRARQGRV